MIYKIMKYNVDIDFSMIFLNATSFGALALAWMTEHLAGVGGFILVISIAALNFAKAWAIFKGKKIKK